MKTNPSPAVHAGHPPKFLTPKEVAARVGLSPTQLRREVEAGRFPKPVRATEFRINFVEAEVEAWMLAKMAERGAA